MSPLNSSKYPFSLHYIGKYPVKAGAPNDQVTGNVSLPDSFCTAAATSAAQRL